MSALPVITAMGGINAAGRSAQHFAFQRLIFDALDSTQQRDTLSALSRLTGNNSEAVLAHTLIRALPDSHQLHGALAGTSAVSYTHLRAHET